MTVCYLAPDPIQSTFFIPGGNTVANGGQLFVYLAGTSTKTTVYKDSGAAAAWSNPIVLDSGGNLADGGEVWIPSGITIKVVYAPANDTDPPASPYWSKDNLSGVNDTSVTASEWVLAGTPTFVSANSFTLTGDQSALISVGRRVKLTVTAGTVYGTVAASSYSVITTVTVQLDSGAIDSGLSAVYYGLISSAHSSAPPVTWNAQPEVHGRLTLTPALPTRQSDTTGTTALYFWPLDGNTVDLYSSSQATWQRFSFAGVSTAIPNVDSMHDVFAYLSSGAVALSTLAWTDGTTRAANLTSVSGVLLQATDLSKLYLGSFYSASTRGVGTTQSIRDAAAARDLWNYYNRQPRTLSRLSTTASWQLPAGAALRSANSDSTMAVSFVLGIGDVPVYTHLRTMPKNNAGGLGTSVAYTSGFGLDQNTSLTLVPGHVTGRVDLYGPQQFYEAHAVYVAPVAAGKHQLFWLEGLVGGTTASLSGTGVDQTGIVGWLPG